MDEFLSRHARIVLLGDRQCTATARDGTRCGRASALGQFVCNLHGAKAPLSLKAARERLMMLAEPALDALLRALQTGPPCEVCGRSDVDRDPTVIAAARIVLDRAGLHPSLSVQVQPPPVEDFSHLSAPEAAEAAEKLLVRARRLVEMTRHEADAEAARLLPEATEGVLIDDGIEVPEDDAPLEALAPASEDALRSIPLQEATKEPASD